MQSLLAITISDITVLIFERKYRYERTNSTCFFLKKQNFNSLIVDFSYGVMARIIDARFLNRGDPCIVNMLNLFRVSKLKDLKEKELIHIPKDVFVSGVLDGTGSLEEWKFMYVFRMLPR